MCADFLSKPSSEAARSGLPDRERMAASRVAAAEWSAEQVIALGDSHDKGELSLCVGEAA